MGVLCCREASACLEMETLGGQSGFVLQPDEDPSLLVKICFQKTKVKNNEWSEQRCDVTESLWDELKTRVHV